MLARDSCDIGTEQSSEIAERIDERDSGGGTGAGKEFTGHRPEGAEGGIDSGCGDAEKNCGKQDSVRMNAEEKSDGAGEGASSVGEVRLARAIGNRANEDHHCEGEQI